MSLTASQSFCLASNPGGGDFIYNGEDIHLTDTQVSITDGPPTPFPNQRPSHFWLVPLVCWQ